MKGFFICLAFHFCHKLLTLRIRTVSMIQSPGASSCLSEPNAGALGWWKGVLCKLLACFSAEESSSARSRTHWLGREQRQGGRWEGWWVHLPPTWCLLAVAVRPSFPSTSKSSYWRQMALQLDGQHNQLVP